MVFRAFSFNDTESHFPNIAQKFLTFIQSLFLRWMRESCCACRRQIVAFTLSEEIMRSLSMTNRCFCFGEGYRAGTIEDIKRGDALMARPLRVILKA